mmetsp:Transcript_37986/g.100409  ORF Transcript_37986/g.100409 Transcript_37986/m.100409 type:complete len:218 (-) Transcript_37986:354-1007(-)
MRAHGTRRGTQHQPDECMLPATEACQSQRGGAKVCHRRRHRDPTGRQQQGSDTPARWPATWTRAQCVFTSNSIDGRGAVGAWHYGIVVLPEPEVMPMIGEQDRRPEVCVLFAGAERGRIGGVHSHQPFSSVRKRGDLKLPAPLVAILHDVAVGPQVSAALLEVRYKVRRVVAHVDCNVLATLCKVERLAATLQVVGDRAIEAVSICRDIVYGKSKRR